MANVSIEVFDGQEWKPITSGGTDGIKTGSGKPAESLNGKIYFNMDTSVSKSSEKIYFNV